MINSQKIRLSLLILLMGIAIVDINSFFCGNSLFIDTDTDLLMNSDLHAKNNDKVSSVFDCNSANGWADTRFKYRKNITINAINSDENLKNFPVLLDLFDKDLKYATQSYGYDLMFIDKLGKKLNHEIEKFDQNFNSTHLHLITWIKMNLSCTYDTSISMYYGSDSVSDQEETEAVWDKDFVGVWHLSETIGTHYDSTKNKLDTSPQNYDNDESVNGVIDGANELDGINDYIETYKLPSEIGIGAKTPKTVSLWVCPKDFNGGGVFEFGKRESTRGYYSLGTHSSPNNWRVDWGGVIFNDFTYVSLNNWVYLTVVYDGNKNVKVYINNQIQVNDSETKLNILDDSTLKFGKWNSNTFKGIIDEVRVSKVARSDSWIKTEFFNQYDPNSFYSIGSQESDDNPPVLNDFGVYTKDNQGLVFYAVLTDEQTGVKNVKIKINDSQYDMIQNTSTNWIYEYSSVLFGDIFFYQIANASDNFNNYWMISSELKCFSFTEDFDPPKVKSVYFIINNVLSPTNLTFFAEVEEFGSGIKEVTLYYYFEECNQTENTGGEGSSLILNEETVWFTVMMQLHKEYEQYHVYSVTVPFSQNETNWRVMYRISTTDNKGNIDVNAFSNDLEEIETNVIVFNPPNDTTSSLISDSFIFIIFMNIILVITVITFVSGVYIRFFGKSSIVRLDKDLVMENAEKISDSELKASINKHTLGILLSKFHQRIWASTTDGFSNIVG